jgi:hypothetical protein
VNECVLTYSSSVFRRKLEEEKSDDALPKLTLEKNGCSKDTIYKFLSLLSACSYSTMSYNEFPNISEKSFFLVLPLVLKYECTGLLSMMKFQTKHFCECSNFLNVFSEDLKNLVDALLKCDKDREWVTEYVLNCELAYLLEQDEGLNKNNKTKTNEDVMKRVESRGGMDPSLFSTLLLHTKRKACEK